ncbi:hypothetical protein KCP73_18240 [Salmonella enterica subsp. enterica]|nr:hypothetical protein KCP73_18240 [Salmonella enterica subsp. enterica]
MAALINRKWRMNMRILKQESPSPPVLPSDDEVSMVRPTAEEHLYADLH